jgi:hypothetical protein
VASDDGVSHDRQRHPAELLLALLPALLTLPTVGILTASSDPLPSR